MAIVLPQGKQQFFTDAGNPAVGWRLYTYIPNTTTLKDTYTTSVGNVANQNPVVMDARGEAAIYWVGAYDVILKNQTDVTIWGPERLEDSGLDVRSDLSNTSSTSLGDALVGVKRTATSYATTEHVVNEWREINVVSDCGADPTNTLDSTSAIQLAIASGRDVFIPAGTYKIASSLTVPTGRKGLTIRGEYLLTKLEAIFAGPIIQFPSGLTTQYIVIDGITFRASGTGNGAATGIAGNAGLAYVMLSDFRNCQFSGSLRYGFDGNFLQGEFNRCGFGSDQTPTGGNTFKPLRLRATDVFQTTIRLINCEIGSGNDDYAIDAQWGTDLTIQGGAIEVNATTTAVIGVTDFNLVRLDKVWVESNGPVPLVKTHDGAHGPVDCRVSFAGCYLAGNGSGANDVLIDNTNCVGKSWSIIESVIVSYTKVSLDTGIYDIQTHIMMRYGNKSFSSSSNFLEEGVIGEYSSASQPNSTNFPTSTQYGDAVSISLGSGDWDIDAILASTLNAATLSGQPLLGVSTVSGDSSSGLVFGDTLTASPGPTAAFVLTCNLSGVRFLLTQTTTIYLKVRCDYTGGPPQYRCRISARRRS